MREGLITSYHKSLIKRPLWSRSIIRSLIRQTIFLEKIKDQGNIKEVIRKCALEGCAAAFVANPWAVRFPGFLFFFFPLPLGIPRIPPRFANFSPSMMIPRRVLRGWRRYIHSGTIIFFENDSCFDVLAFECIESNKTRRIKKLLLELQKIETKILSNLYISPIQIINVLLYFNSLLHLESSSANNKFL